MSIGDGYLLPALKPPATVLSHDIKKQVMFLLISCFSKYNSREVMILRQNLNKMQPMSIRRNVALFHNSTGKSISKSEYQCTSNYLSINYSNNNLLL